MLLEIVPDELYECIELLIGQLYLVLSAKSSPIKVKPSTVKFSQFISLREEEAGKLLPNGGSVHLKSTGGSIFAFLPTNFRFLSPVATTASRYSPGFNNDGYIAYIRGNCSIHCGLYGWIV